MKQFKFSTTVFLPSPISGALALIVSIGLFILLLTISWLPSAQNSWTYKTLLGPGSFAESFRTSRDTLEAVGQTMFRNEGLNMVMMVAFTLSIIVAVYLTLLLGRRKYSLTERLQRFLHYGNHRKQILEQKIMARALTRILAILLWFLYMVLFLRVIVPYLAYSVTWAINWPPISLADWSTLLAGFFVAVLSLHVHVILMRLALLRPQVRSGWDKLLKTEGGQLKRR